MIVRKLPALLRIGRESRLDDLIMAIARESFQLAQGNLQSM